MKKKFQVRNGKEYNARDYKIYLEGMAEGIIDTAYELGFDDGCGKMSDPLFFTDEGLGNVYSYMFDFHDGGRHHKFDSLGEVYEGLLKEIKKYKT